MIPLWRSLFKSMFGQRGAAAPDTTVRPAAPAQPSSTVPPGVFDRRPAVGQSTPLGVFCLPADFAGDAVGRAIADGHPVSAALSELARKYAAPGEIALDIGAGFGGLSVLLSDLAGPAGQVLAFEADEYLCDVMQQTMRFNQRENVRVFYGAVYDDSRATVAFPAIPAAADAPYSGQRVDPAATGAVQTRSIDRMKIDARISCLFIDTNGSELQVLRGATATIARFRMPVVIQCAPAGLAATIDALKIFFDALHYEIDCRPGSALCVALPQNHAGTGRPASAIEQAHPDIHAPAPPSMATLCKVLQSHAQIDECTRYLKQWGYVPHNIACKNWDLAHLVPAIGDGNFLDMGSSDSYILKNLAHKRIRGELYGIDLRAPDVPISNVRYLIGDLMRTPLPDGHFANITCLSVLEHQVDYDKFAAEASRLLAPGGRVFVTFDYWEPRVTPPVKLYELDWMPLDAAMVRRFISSCARHGLDIVENFDFTAGEPLIRWGYYSPHPDINYTFGMAAFRKR